MTSTSLACPFTTVANLATIAGYHRLWAHTSYKATLPLQIYLAAVGVGAAEGSIRWWSKGHRAHHRYTDTVKDPYSVRKGFVYAHIGWLVMKQNPKRIGRSDITDLNEDPIVVWQHVNYLVRIILARIISGWWPTRAMVGALADNNIPEMCNFHGVDISNPGLRLGMG